MTIFRRRSSGPGLNGPARSPARSCNDGHRSPCCHARVPRPSRVSIPRVGVGMRHCSRSSSLPSPRVSRSWTRISRNALPPMPTRTASAPCPVPVRRAPRDCSPPSAPTVVGSPPPPPPCSRAGIAPITVRSGQQEQVRWRWCTNTVRRQTFHEFAGHSVRHCLWAKRFYHRQRTRGTSHHAALRALAFKWIRILWRCWHDHTVYDDARYTSALTLRGAPLTSALRARIHEASPCLA